MSEKIDALKKNINIFNINENDFNEKVIEASEEKIVLVDFWAPWCEPCKQLTPTLEKIVTEANGIVLLAKINIDENQQIAAQLRIQSIPTVMAFYKKQMANGFQGAIPKAKIMEFIEKVYGSPLPKSKNEFYLDVADNIKNNDFESALELIENFISENSEDPKAISLYIKCLYELKKLDDAKNFIDSLSEKTLSENEVKKEIKNFEMIKSASQSDSINDLEECYKNNPDKIENILKLSERYFYEKQIDNSLNLLIDSFLKFKNQEREKIKEKLLNFFDVLGNDNEKTIYYRRKLSSLLFS